MGPAWPSRNGKGLWSCTFFHGARWRGSGRKNGFVPGASQDRTGRWDSSRRTHAPARVSSCLLGRILALPRGSRGHPDHVALGAAGNSPEWAGTGSRAAQPRRAPRAGLCSFPCTSPAAGAAPNTPDPAQARLSAVGRCVRAPGRSACVWPSAPLLCGHDSTAAPAAPAPGP